MGRKRTYVKGYGRKEVARRRDVDGRNDEKCGSCQRNLKKNNVGQGKATGGKTHGKRKATPKSIKINVT